MKKMSELKRITTQYSYSAAVEAGDFVFLGIRRGLGDTFVAQLDNTFKNMELSLAEFGLTLADLVKVNVWLKHIEDLPEMEKRFRNYFEKDKYPARMTSTTEFIDEDCLIMIDGVAYRKNK
jgi:2-iminobutanoate/2-iminopropanoate deaminase